MIAEIVDPLKEGAAARTLLKATTNGRLFTRARQRLAWPGLQLGKVQGLTPLPDRVPGKLMYD